MRLFMSLVCTITFIGLAIWSGVGSWRVHQKMQYLTLADDASTPAQKSEYLGKFIDVMKENKLPEHGAFFFYTERNKVSNQFKVIESLKSRCDDLIGKNVESMGYATGMQQITGQEFDHATSQVANVFSGALWVNFGIWRCYSWILALIISIGFWIIFAIHYE